MGRMSGMGMYGKHGTCESKLLQDAWGRLGGNFYTLVAGKTYFAKNFSNIWSEKKISTVVLDTWSKVKYYTVGACEAKYYIVDAREANYYTVDAVKSNYYIEMHVDAGAHGKHEAHKWKFITWDAWVAWGCMVSMERVSQIYYRTQGRMGVNFYMMHVS